jgi:hypothetical protein
MIDEYELIDEKLDFPLSLCNVTLNRIDSYPTAKNSLYLTTIPLPFIPFPSHRYPLP